MSRKEKIITVIAIAAYYVLLPLALFYLYLIAALVGIIHLYSEPLFYFLFIGLPVLLLILPVFIRFIRRIRFSRAIRKSFIAIFVWFLIILCVHAGIVGSFRAFTTDKWQNHPYLRHLMMEDLDEKYDFVGMTKDAVSEILGEHYSRDKEGIKYYMIKSFLFIETEFCLEYDENGVITKTYTEFTDLL